MTNGDSLLITGEIGRDSLGLSGFFILRSDTLGNLGSIKFFRDPALDDHQLLDGREPVIINKAENIVIAGVFLARDDLYMMELNQGLDTLWYREYISDYLTMYAQDVTEHVGSYFITGFVQSQNYDLDVFIQKVSIEGNKIWEKTYGIPSRDETGRAAIVEDGGLTVMISESYDPTPTIKNDTRYWIRFMHIDTSGAIVRDWKEEVTNYEGWSGSLLKYGSDYIYTTNKVGEEFSFGPFLAGQIVRRDSSFNIVWRKTYGEPDNYFNGLGDMIFSADSNLLVTGQILDDSKKFVLERVMKVNLDGDLLCETRDTGRILGNGESLNTMEGVAEIESGSVFAVGYTYLGGGFYEGLLLKVTKDGCIDTIVSTTDIEDLIRLQEEKFLVYPNPVKNEITIKLSETIPKPYKVFLYNSFGGQVGIREFYEQTNTLDMSGLPAGIYYLTVSSNGHMFGSRKLVKIE